MNITITGSLGNVGRRLTEKLVARGHRVTVVSHSPERIAAMEALHAIPAIGSLQDAAFLQEAFAGADAVYIMIPPDPSATNVRKYIREAGDRYAQVIARCGVQYVVNLSSIGAHIPDGAGPAGANYYVEQKLNALADTHVLHLRPGMFYTNFLGAMNMIRYQNIIGNNFDASLNMILSHPHDIADAAAEALHTRSFSGKKIQYIASDERNGSEIASVLGRAIGQPDLAWINISDEQMLQGMLQNGLTEEMATVYILDIGRAIRESKLFDDYAKNRHTALGSIKLEDFAKEFAVVYKQALAMAEEAK
ncbi:MAG TPA: NAD(P)H-binding protein [Ohtaekwangia sp.]|uniref:NAD(P)H-binding protein n=1 Tax=Ohtaekwangia sp. TaxID=2066019 RepID=UPI002F94F8EF